MAMPRIMPQPPDAGQNRHFLLPPGNRGAPAPGRRRAAGKSPRSLARQLVGTAGLRGLYAPHPLSYAPFFQR